MFSQLCWYKAVFYSIVKCALVAILLMNFCMCFIYWVNVITRFLFASRVHRSCDVLKGVEDMTRKLILAVSFVMMYNLD